MPARAYTPVPPEPVRGSMREDGAFVPEGKPSDWDLPSTLDQIASNLSWRVDRVTGVLSPPRDFAEGSVPAAPGCKDGPRLCGLAFCQCPNVASVLITRQIAAARQTFAGNLHGSKR